MKNLFLDSNIWLSLYHFSKNDLKQFSKLQDHLGTNIKLWIPQQVVDEIMRNRDAIIQRAFATFSDWKPQLPNFCKGYEECKQFSKVLDRLEKAHKQWTDKIRKDIRERTLPADNVIKQLFNAVTVIECPKQIISAAVLRYRMGNPPGKDHRFGDAINWECLLENIPKKEDLYVVSDDSDYQSALGKYTFNSFLAIEWEQKKESEIHYYPDLESFLNEHIKDIRLQDERKKEALIRDLKLSSSYSSTHQTIAKMWKYSNWTTQQIDSLCTIAVVNSQIRDIFNDPEIRGFFKRCLSSIDKLSESMQQIKFKLSPPPPPRFPPPPLPRTPPPPPPPQ